MFTSRGMATDGKLSPKETPVKSVSDCAAPTWRIKQPGNYTLWAVVRDVRGGASWQEYELTVHPMR
ncbi:MAG: hypothetical protein JXR76_04245 [Deltaproteobacteria bacterium]|nr:hypothetical protein [Deltaproteobacteria bacterium]